MRKYAIPSASRIEALFGSRRFAFSSATVACAAIPLRRCARPCWKSSYVSLMRTPPTQGTSTSGARRPRFQRAKVGKVLAREVVRRGQVARRPDDDPGDVDARVDRVL